MAFRPLPDVLRVERKEAEQTKPDAASAERARLLAVKQALLVTASTPGWQYIKGIAKNITNNMLEKALDAKTDERDDRMADARAAREIFRRLFQTVETTMAFTEEGLEEWFENLDEFTAAKENENGNEAF